jgi:hypothetical protein
MADFISAITPNTDLTVADFDGRGPGDSTSLATGDIRRKYNFGSRVSELAIPQDPFFRFVSKVAKKATDDPQFKFSEKRPSFHKRYAYVMGYVQNDGADEFADDTIEAQNDGGTGTSVAVGDTLKLYMAGDYKSAGNVQNVFGNTSSKIDVGVSGTTPKFFIPGQVIKIPTMTESATNASSWGASYMLARISAVDADTWVSTAKDLKYPTVVTCKVVKASSSSYVGYAGFDNNDFAPSGADREAVSAISIASVLERARTYVVGSAHQEGSGFPETWIDQPYQSNHGLTQIWKTSMAMTNTARATVLKFEPNEWARVWKEKLIEHKWDIETSLLFGSQYTDGDSIQYTQGAVDYITGYGNSFSLDPTTKTQDAFLDDLSNYIDPRYNNSQATMFFCNTAVYNWLHKLSGYFANNVGVIQPGSGNTSPTSFPAQTAAGGSLGRADMSLIGRKKIFGVDITQISTVYGDMNVARNIHLDGTNVKMLGINMKNCAYRPLVGNGINRDTSVYVGVQTLENSGVDRRVDQILTEAGMEWSMAESHAIWT